MKNLRHEWKTLMKHEDNRVTARMLFAFALVAIAAVTCYAICLINFFHMPHVSLDGENFRLSFSKDPAIRTAAFGLAGYAGMKVLPWQIRRRFRKVRLPFQRLLFKH